MARTRNLKPGVFANDVLGSLPPLARLLFIGLPTICDREGRLLDRPMMIKKDILPYDNANMDKLLELLATTKDADGMTFIIRYEVQGVRYIAIPKFLRHNTPYPAEARSIIPPPPNSGNLDLTPVDGRRPAASTAHLAPEALAETERSVSDLRSGRTRGRSSENADVQGDTDPHNPQAPPKTNGAGAQAGQNGRRIIARSRGSSAQSDIPPPPVLVRAYFADVLHRPDCSDGFLDHYTGNGWIVGKTPMRDWQASARSWVTREEQFGVERLARKRATAPLDVGESGAAPARKKTAAAAKSKFLNHPTVPDDEGFDPP